jgi:transcriptional regulator with XRE-family HTH domain
MLFRVTNKIIHFGEFVRWHRVNQAVMTTEAFAREVGLTARRLIAIEAMSTPDIQPTTRAALAKAMGIDPDDFDKKWRSTPVEVTRRKSGPTTDEARLFRAACAASDVTPIEGTRRLRSWFVAQSAELQRQALAHPGPFTDAVDHVQDPAESTRGRIGRRSEGGAVTGRPTTTPGTPPAGAARSGSKRR